LGARDWGQLAMTDPERIAGHIQLIRELSNDLASYLHSLPDDVWRNADQYASGCDRWKMADVVTHLIWNALSYTIGIPPAIEGRTVPPMGYVPLQGQEEVERIISLRFAYDEDLFPEFNASCRGLNTLLASLQPDDYQACAWHPRGTVSVSRLIEHRLLELAVHGWDIRYGLDRSATLNQKALPFLTDWMGQWLSAVFEKNDSLETPISYRFHLNDPITESYDVVVAGDDFRLQRSDQSKADVTFHCDTDTYLLLSMGRLPFARSVRRGRLSFEGNEERASAFTKWFRPLESLPASDQHLANRWSGER